MYLDASVFDVMLLNMWVYVAGMQMSFLKSTYRAYFYFEACQSPWFLGLKPVNTDVEPLNINAKLACFGNGKSQHLKKLD